MGTSQDLPSSSWDWRASSGRCSRSIPVAQAGCLTPADSAPMHDRNRAVRVRPFQSHEWRLYRELRLNALRDAADAFGSTLAREEAFPDQEWIRRLAVGAASSLDLPLVAEESGRAVGLAWVRIDAADLGTATLYQVWVHPEF